VLLQRQVQHSTDSWAVGQLGQLCELLLQLADCSPGWGQNLLGAIGLGSAATIGVRGKFLARALYLFLRSASVPTSSSASLRVLLTEDKTNLVERTLEEGNGSREKMLLSAEVKPNMEKILALKKDKGMTGIHDLIDWTVAQIRDDSNSLMDAHLFIDRVVINKLYVDLFLQS